MEWTPEGYERTVRQGLQPAEVHTALTAPGRRLIAPITDDMISVLIRIRSGTLVEVWLQDSPDDDAREVFIAFDAGAIGTARWHNAHGQQG